MGIRGDNAPVNLSRGFAKKLKSELENSPDSLAAVTPKKNLYGIVRPIIVTDSTLVKAIDGINFCKAKFIQKKGDSPTGKEIKLYLRLLGSVSENQLGYAVFRGRWELLSSNFSGHFTTTLSESFVQNSTRSQSAIVIFSESQFSVFAPLLKSGETIAAGKTVVVSWCSNNNRYEIIQAEC